MREYSSTRSTSVSFWDRYAKWYKLWMDHTNYHEKIIEVLLAMTGPGWRVLDIGAGNGILSIPLHVRGCHVTALEPSIGMRSLLYEELFKYRIDSLTVDDRMWEEAPCYEFLDYDLILACNSLHLTQTSLEEGLAKIFRASPRNVLFISDFRSHPPPVKWCYGDYKMVFTKTYEGDSSYAYHHLNEVVEHWSFKKGRALQTNEIHALLERIVLKGGHLWMRDTARVMMCWWEKNNGTQSALPI